MSVLSLSYADTNGIWHNPSDIRGGVFGENEQVLGMDFTFMNQVFFLEDINGSRISVDEICLLGVCHTNLLSSSTVSSYAPPLPPVCTGDKALQWDGSSWSCTAFVLACTDTSWSPSISTVCSGEGFIQMSNCGNARSAIGTKPCSTCSDDCSYSGQKTCLNDYALICGYYDSDPCLEWNSGTYCSAGCSAGACDFAHPPWYEEHSGVFDDNGYYHGTLGRWQGSINVGYSGIITGNVEQTWYYLDPSLGYGVCDYVYVEIDNSVLFDVSSNSDSTCPEDENDMNWYLKSEVEPIGFIYHTQNYLINGHMNEDGAFSGTWSGEGSSSSNSISGQGSADGSMITVNYISAEGTTGSFMFFK